MLADAAPVWWCGVDAGSMRRRQSHSHAFSGRSRFTLVSWPPTRESATNVNGARMHL
jgi:hypothetical protein